MREAEAKETGVSSPPEPPEMQEQASVEVPQGEDPKRMNAELREMNDKYLRLYAEFENYKKYGNENILYDLLPVIDNLEMALQHASNDVSSGLVQGVEITLKELRKALEKFGLTPIEALGRAFDPLVHHAMTQVERDDVAEKTITEEYRKGYRLRDKVLRPSLVAVSKKMVSEPVKEESEERETTKTIEEEL
jgi:molecular chaperone GrpE